MRWEDRNMKKLYQIPTATIVGFKNEDILTFLRLSSDFLFEFGKARSVIDFEEGVLNQQDQA